jgi:hypothetical protein
MGQKQIGKENENGEQDRSAKDPPFIDLGEALRLAKEIYTKGGGRLSKEEFSKIVGNSTKSSWFRLKVVALRSFGLIKDSKWKEDIELSPLAMSILAPQSAQESATAKLEALNSLPDFRSAAQRYQGKPEPTERAFVENFFAHEQKIPPNQEEKSRKWAECFLVSARAADLFKSTIEIDVHSKVGIEDKPPKREAVDEAQQESLGRELTRELTDDEIKAGWLFYQIPVTGKDRPRIIIPPGLKRKDFEKMKKVLEALAPEEEENSPFKES